MMDQALHSGGSYWIAEPTAPGCRLQRGDHSHEAWEIFCPLQQHLAFACAGCDPTRHAPGTVLLIPPGVLHREIHDLPQPPGLQLLVLDLPGPEHAQGSISMGVFRRQRRTVLSPEERRQWEQHLGQAPNRMLDQAAQGLPSGNRWERERAVNQLRLLFSSFMEVSSGRPDTQRERMSRHVIATRNALQTRYYDPEVNAQTLATSLGVSPTHLRRIFRTETGRSIHQTLLDVRIRQAQALLKKNEYSIKEIAFLTGWNHPLYFSAAFRKHCGLSPTAFRNRER